MVATNSSELLQPNTVLKRTAKSFPYGIPSQMITYDFKLFSPYAFYSFILQTWLN